MTLINDLLKKIKEAIYGEEVRNSIHDAIEQCYKDATGHPDSVAATVKEIGEVSANLSKETADRKAEANTERKRIDNLIANGTAQTQEIGKKIIQDSSISSSGIVLKGLTNNNYYYKLFEESGSIDSEFCTITNQQGKYTAKLLKPGLYYMNFKVHVEMSGGFSEEVIAPLKLFKSNTLDWSTFDVLDAETVEISKTENTSINKKIHFLFRVAEPSYIRIYIDIDTSHTKTITFRIDGCDIIALDWKGKQSANLSELHDLRIGADGVVHNTAGEAVRKQIGNLTEDIAEISEVDETDNKYNPFSDECIDESYLQTFDIIEDTRLKISNKIHVKKGDIVRFIKNSFTNKNAGAIYNTNGLPQVSIYSNGYTEETWNDYVICASVSPIDGYYLVNMEKRGDATVNMIFVNKSFPADGKFVPYHRERLIRKSCIEKYIEPFGLTANVLNGNYEEVYSNIPLSFNKVDGYYNKNGKFFANEGYEEAVVDVKKGEKYYLTSYNYFQIARAFFRDSSGTFVGSVYTANNNKLEENTEVAIPENAVTMHLQRLTNKRVELLGKTGYELIARVNEVSPLYGKKLVTAGDSYTHASFSGNYAEYDGKNYGYYVAKRHGMTFINSGMSGSIMALDKDYVANPTSVPITSRNPFSYQRYLDVPEDTDYLTIWFGINDNAHTNLGTIDDATNETFYGAWNKVLRYYLTNRPFMKVGLIVTVGASERYRQAIRDVAKKWGYPYLDWVNDDSIPAFFDRTGMSDEARTLRRQAYGYNDFSAHPNPQFHEYVSTIYEKFLLSL